ncbi:hypothetical protein IVA88_27825 [Bradyrhizobium sp. 149]|uniref:hypothetical protein n=1 Tax=Bradyrhizobium sp. 149 TaxID=2782624 RepID=UPI001FF7EC2F|nr:hypothetical protein [Bradyrhizobium sp. 149]MCK1655228.1 hypothetical protein [Bradyrhizobium sp. 149]
MPQATHEGVIRFGTIEIEVSVLDDGQRVITQSGFMVGLGRIRPPKGRQYYRGSANLPAFLKVPNLKPFISEDLLELANQIEFRSKKGVKAFGYKARFLAEACDVFACAQRAGVLKATQRNVADRARIIAEQLKLSGTTHLINEATRHQEAR